MPKDINRLEQAFVGTRRSDEPHVLEYFLSFDCFDRDDADSLGFSFDQCSSYVFGGFGLSGKVELVAERQIAFPLGIAAKIGGTGFRFDNDSLVPVIDGNEIRPHAIVSTDRRFAVFLNAHERQRALANDGIGLVRKVGAEVPTHHEHAFSLG